MEGNDRMIRDFFTPEKWEEKVKDLNGSYETWERSPFTGEHYWRESKFPRLWKNVSEKLFPTQDFQNQKDFMREVYLHCSMEQFGYALFQNRMDDEIIQILEK